MFAIVLNSIRANKVRFFGAATLTKFIIAYH